MKKLIPMIFLVTMLFRVYSYEVPAMSNPLGLRVYLLPQKTGKEVRFTFIKRDANGRPGGDTLNWFVNSPSGKTVCEGIFPDDGDETASWKRGPVQEADVRFIPWEQGVYTLSFNMDCDARLYFNQTKAINVHWGLQNSNFRTDNHFSKIQTWFYLIPRKAGEPGDIEIVSNYMHYSRLVNMTLRTEKQTFYENYTAPAAPNKKNIFTHHFKIPRSNADDLYELKADQFYVISFVPQSYPMLTFFFDRASAAAFKPWLKKMDMTPNRIEYPAGSGGKITLAPGHFYRMEYHADKQKDFHFRAAAFGKTLTFDSRKTSHDIEIPLRQCFSAVAYPDGAKLDGRFIFTRMVRGNPDIQFPENCAVVNPSKKGILCASLRMLGAKSYLFELEHELGTKYSFTSSTPEFTFTKHLPGVWKVRAASEKKDFGAWSYFAVRDPANTTPIYAHGFNPAMDSAVKAVNNISLKLLVPVTEIDLKRSSFRINGMRKSPVIQGDKILGVAVRNIEKGKVDVVADLFDKAGNRSVYEWCFMLDTPAEKKLSFDKNGILIFNGRKFLPLIIYPPVNNQRGDLGFNTILPNTLSDIRTLDFLLARNMKTLDSGCVFRGFYTAKDSTPLKDIANYMNGPGGKHPARLGAWMDEADAYISDKDIFEHLNEYRKHSLNSGVAGVCTTGRQRYADMAKLGDYLMTDIYPREDVLSCDYFFAKALRDADGKPVWQLNQGFDYNWSVRDPEKFIPNIRQVKYAHWAAFRHGLQGVGLYMCGSTRMMNYQILFARVVALYRNTAALAFVLVEPPVSGILEVPKSLKNRVIRYENRIYAIVQNASLTAFPATIKVNGNYNSKIRVLMENRLLKLYKGGFSDVFQPLESRVYELTEE